MNENANPTSAKAEPFFIGMWVPWRDEPPVVPERGADLVVRRTAEQPDGVTDRMEVVVGRITSLRVTNDGLHIEAEIDEAYAKLIGHLPLQVSLDENRRPVLEQMKGARLLPHERRALWGDD